MRILYVNAVGFIGGAERQLIQMIGAVRRSAPGADVHLLTLGDGALVDECRAMGITVWPIALPERLAKMGDSALRDGGKMMRLLSMSAVALNSFPAAVSTVIDLRRTIREIRADVIHAHGIKAHILGKLIFPPSVPVVWHVHDYMSLRPLAGKLLKFAGRGISAIAAISESVKLDAASVVGNVPIRVIPNTVELQHFSPGIGDGARLDALAGLPPAPRGTLRVGLVATFARWKGHAIFLEAARLIRGFTHCPVRFYVIGGAVYHTANQFSLGELQALAMSFRIEKDVAFVPFQHDIAEIYRALDIVVHASTLPEPFGLSIVEAMACARPVIVSNGGGASELFTDGYDALGTTPGDASALARSIARLVDEPELREKLASRARATVELKFNARRLGPDLMALYRDVLKT